MLIQHYPVKILGTQGSLPLARQICAVLEAKLPEEMIPPGGILRLPKVDEFHNENMEVQLPDSVSWHTVVVVHTMTPPFHQEMSELYALLDAIMNSTPAEIVVAFAYEPWSRSDKKDKPRISVMGRRFAMILNRAYGIKKVILLDPHASYLKEYFDPEAKEVTAVYLLVDYLQRCVFSSSSDDNRMIIHPDAGAVTRFKDVVRYLQLPVTIILKSHFDNSGRVEIKKLIGDPSGKDCYVIDDEVLSFDTANRNALKLLEAGARSVRIIVTHAILREKGTSDQDLIARMVQSPISQFIFTDSVPVLNKLPKGTGKFVVLPIAGLMAEAIRRMVVSGQSPTDMFSVDTVGLFRQEPTIP